MDAGGAVVVPPEAAQEEIVEQWDPNYEEWFSFGNEPLEFMYGGEVSAIPLERAVAPGYEKSFEENVQEDMKSIAKSGRWANPGPLGKKYLEDAAALEEWRESGDEGVGACGRVCAGCAQCWAPELWPEKEEQALKQSAAQRQENRRRARLERAAPVWQEGVGTFLKSRLSDGKAEKK